MRTFDITCSIVANIENALY